MNYKFNLRFRIPELNTPGSNAVDEDDDAAFRARLEPLASEVLPRPTLVGVPNADRVWRPSGGTVDAPRSPRIVAPAADRLRASPAGSPDADHSRSAMTGTSAAERPRKSLRVAALAGIATVIVLAGGAWLYFERPWPGPDNAHASARPDTTPRTSTANRNDAGAVPFDASLPPRSSLASAESKPKSIIQGSVRAVSPPDTTPTLQTPALPASSPRSLPPGAPAASASPDMIGLLFQRGGVALANGDIIAARMLFERAAALGSAAAATSVGKTYDFEFLSQAGVRGIRADQTSAVAWFRKAAALGDPEAMARLARIESQNRP